jgi:hypothetical protein
MNLRCRPSRVARGDWEDAAPAALRDYGGEGGEPESVGRFVADTARDLAAQHGVLMAQHKQLGVLGAIAAQQYRRDGQQRPGQLVEK